MTRKISGSPPISFSRSSYCRRTELSSVVGGGGNSCCLFASNKSTNVVLNNSEVNNTLGLERRDVLSIFGGPLSATPLAGDRDKNAVEPIHSC